MADRGLTKIMEVIDQLKVSTGWIEIEIFSEPNVILTFKGYVPTVQVKVLRSGLMKHLFIAAKSLSNALEPLRKNNNNSFTGLRIRIAKEDESPISAYKVETLAS